MPIRIRTWSLDVADDASGLVIHELDADLGDTTTRTCFDPNALVSLSSLFLSLPFVVVDGDGGVGGSGGWGDHTGSSENSGNSDELDGLLSGIHCLAI